MLKIFSIAAVLCLSSSAFAGVTCQVTETQGGKQELKYSISEGSIQAKLYPDVMIDASEIDQKIVTRIFKANSTPDKILISISAGKNDVYGSLVLGTVHGIQVECSRN